MADLEKSSEAIEEPAFQAEVDELERETSEEEEEEEEETDAVSREKLQALGKSHSQSADQANAHVITLFTTLQGLPQH